MTTLNLQVSASLDDSRENNSGDNVPTALTIDLQSAGGFGGWRWDNVTVPKDSTINTCSIQVYFETTSSDDPNTSLAFEASDDAPAFTSDANNISDRTRTATTHTWTDTALGTGFSVSVDLAGSLDDVTTRAGWVSGNAVVMIWDSLGSPTDNSEIDTYDDTTANAGKLDIDYTAPTGGVVIMHRRRNSGFWG